MKTVCFTFLLVCGFLLASLVDADDSGSRDGDRTITKVVKLLQKMLDKSKKDGEDDKLAYAKYKCYVDTSEAEKKESIKKLTEEIALLESEIAELQARNAELSTQSARLNADMTANKAAQKSATAIRKSSKKSFEEMEEDLEKGLDQMKEAIDVLTAIAMNQVSGHKKDMMLLNLGSKVQESLAGASALLSPENRKVLDSFLQAPLAATHSAQGDAIVDILKKLKTTFEDNLKSAQESEEAEKKIFKETIETLKDSWDKMDKTLKEKEQEIGDNEGDLSSKKTSLEEAIKQKEEDEEFLEKLEKMAKKKAKNYEERNMLRANEEAAIAEAISILNSDEAFESFGKTDATSTGATSAASFLQLRRLRGGEARQQVEALLEHAAAKGHSTRLARIANGVRTGHTFTAVLEEIEKMKKTIAEEGQADKEQFDWCKKERKNSKKDLEDKKSEIKTLKEAIDKLDDRINDPKTGLKAEISDTEDDLVQNQKDQAEATKTRKEENVAYLEDVKNLSEAESILTKAIKVLKRYYDQLEKHMSENKDSTNLLQEDPKPPETYGDFEGQSSQGGKVIGMLEFILSETEKEHTTADDDEKKSQSDYDDSMDKMKEAERKMQKSLVKLKKDLTEAEKELIEKTSDLKDTTAAKEAIEKYILKIKPGCDFITENFDLREENRNTETKALDKAKGLIKDTPAYKKAVEREKELANGKCKSECKLDTTSLKCKVCMSGDSKADYCKANPGTPGCK